MSCKDCNNKESCAYFREHTNNDSIHAGDNRYKLVKVISAVVLFTVVFTIDRIFRLYTINKGSEAWVLPFVCYFITFMIIGIGMIKEAVKTFKAGEAFTANVLISFISVGLFVIGIIAGCNGEDPVWFSAGCIIAIIYSIISFIRNSKTDNTYCRKGNNQKV